MRRAALLALLLSACSTGKPATTTRDQRSRLQLCQGASSVTRPLRPGDTLGGSDGGIDTVGANGEPVNNQLGCTDR